MPGPGAESAVLEHQGSVPRWVRTLVTVTLLALAGGGGLTYLGRAERGFADGLESGLYVTNFLFSAGIGGAALALGSLLLLLEKPELRLLAVIAELVSASCVVLSGLFVALDLGGPGQLLAVAMYPHPTSMLFWDGVLICCYGLLSLVLLYLGSRCGLPTPWPAPRADARERRLLRVVAWIAVPLAVALYSVEAWMVGLLQASAGLDTPVLAPVFLVSALVSGGGTVILAAIFARWVFCIPIESSRILTLGRYLAVLLPLLMYAVLSELLGLGRAGGPLWLDLALGISLPFVLLGVPAFRTIPTTVLASALLLVGILAERTWILLPSVMRPGVPLSTQTPYTPGPGDWWLMAGAYSLGLLVFWGLGALLFGRLHREERISF